MENLTEAIEKKLQEIEDCICPGDWDIGEFGVKREKVIYNKKGEAVTSVSEIASPIPAVPTAILKNVDTHTEKLELSFYKHNRWQTLVTDRSVTANRNAIIKLADKGLEVNSENAGTLVKYIADVVAGSLFCLPHKPAKSVLGWVDGEFMPYTDSIVFDGDEQFKHLHKAVTSKGTLKEWVNFMRPLRENLEMRLCMATAFASPLIELIGENPFVFHLWGGTGAGKTVAVMVAMSIFGDPSMGKMTRTMNMTVNSMLSTAAFLCNLPFAGDELQAIKTRWGNYDNLIMCITEGVDRGRMSYDKVNETKAWKCSFIFSGEEPCVKQASGGGVKNRVIEVECKEKLVQNGNLVANFVRTHYGCAGELYIDQIKEENVGELYKAYFTEILATTNTTDKQAGAMALILAADQIASRLFWHDEQPLTVEQVQKYLCSAEDVDVAERAYEFVRNHIAENRNNFVDGAKQTWGSISGSYVFINKNVLCRVLTDEGFDFDAVKAKWAERGYLVRDFKNRYTCFKSLNGAQAYYVKIALTKQAEIDEINQTDGLPFEKACHSKPE